MFISVICLVAMVFAVPHAVRENSKLLALNRALRQTLKSEIQVGAAAQTFSCFRKCTNEYLGGQMDTLVNCYSCQESKDKCNAIGYHWCFNPLAGNPQVCNPNVDQCSGCKEEAQPCYADNGVCVFRDHWKPLTQKDVRSLCTPKLLTAKKEIPKCDGSQCNGCKEEAQPCYPDNGICVFKDYWKPLTEKDLRSPCTPKLRN